MSWTRLVCTSCACTPKISQKQWISRSLRVAVAVVTIFFSEDLTKRGWSSRRPSKVNNIKSKGQLATHLIVCSFRAPQMRRSTSRAAKIKISSTNPQSSCVIRMLRSTSRWSLRRTLIGSISSWNVMSMWLRGTIVAMASPALECLISKRRLKRNAIRSVSWLSHSKNWG